MNLLRNFFRVRRIFPVWWRGETSLGCSEPEEDEFCRRSNYPRNSCDAQWMLLYSCVASLEEDRKEEEGGESGPGETTGLDSAKEFIRNIPDQCKFTQVGDTFSQGLEDFDRAISRASSKRELLLILCSIENRCRRKLGKPLVLCNYSEIMKRWYKKRQV